jgi:putative transposase
VVQCRRNYVPGGAFFFTVALRDRRATTLVNNIGALRAAMWRTLRQRPFVIDAMVVLPDHIHTVWTLPSCDVDYAGRWRLLKSCFTQALTKAGAGLLRNARGECDLWQRRYWEHTIRGVADLARHVDYIHFNPVKHRLVERVGDWPYSTFHRYVRGGLYPPFSRSIR